MADRAIALLPPAPEQQLLHEGPACRDGDHEPFVPEQLEGGTDRGPAHAMFLL